MDLLKPSISNETEQFPQRTITPNSNFSTSAFLSINSLNVRHPSTMKHDSIPGTSIDSEMMDDTMTFDPNKGLTTTVLYSPLHIDANQTNHILRPRSPTLQVQCDVDTPHDPSERSIFCRTPPLICEQGPSAPSSPTSPGGRRKPNSLYVDGLQRLDLLSPNFVPSMDFNKLSPLSPSYPTSDLGSSPRSSISMTQSGLGPHWTSFCDFKKSSSDYDGDSDICTKDLLSPGTILSPAPFSPFSDESETPYSQRSPNMSPMPTRHMHFSFDQIRSRSSMSNRTDNHNVDHLMPQMSLDMDSRERSRSEGEMNNTERMDTTINHSTISVPVTSNRISSPIPNQYRKRLLQQCHEDHEHLKHFQQSTESITTIDSSTKNIISSLDQDENDLMNASVSTQVSRQPTIEEPPPEPTFAELFNAADLGRERQRQVEEWLKQQAAALEILRNSLVPMQQESTNLLKVPTIGGGVNPALLAPTQTDMRQLAKILAENSAQQRQNLFRRSHSETDVSGSGTSGSTQRIQEQSFVCEHCGQAFAMHDRLAKHIASRHRDRSSSVNDENSKTHKCTMCSKSFGRSDMLTRHMRLHTGVKPYSCMICGQVFSRSDHLSTHQRTHTGEKPYRCPQCSYSASRRDMITRHMRTHLRPDGSPDQLQINIGQLSLNSRSPLLTPEPQTNNLPPQFPSSSVSGSQTTILAQQLQIPKLTPQTTISNDNTDAAVFAAAAAAAAAQNAAFTNYYAREQLNLAQIGRIDGQSQTNFMCRSTPNIPNLLGNSTVDGTTFRSLTPTNLTSQTSTNNLAVAAAAAFAQKLSPFMIPTTTTQQQQQNNVAMIQQLAAAVQAQQQAQIQATNNLLTPTGLNLTLSTLNSTNGTTGNPMLARQSSIGGFGFG